MRRIQKTHDVFPALVHVFLLYRLYINTHVLIHAFCVENTGKVETGKAIGFKREESNSVISLTDQRRLPEGYGLEYIYER